MTTIAIVSILQTSQGEAVQLLGWGSNEERARQAAFRFVNGGMNRYDEALKGGHAVTVSQKLRDLDRAAAEWDDTFDEDGGLIASSCPDAHQELLAAFGRLFVQNGELSFKDR